MAETTPITVVTGGCAPEGAGAVVLTHPTIGNTAACRCCGPRDDLVRILRGLLPRARRGEISRVIVETAGDVDPAAIREALMSDVAVASVYRLDGM